MGIPRFFNEITKPIGYTYDDDIRLELPFYICILEVMSVNKTAVLSLYKDLIKYGQKLTYTDKSYCFKYMREQFEKNKEKTDINSINHVIEVYNS